MDPISLVLVQNKSGSILNEMFSYKSPLLLSTEDSKILDMHVIPPVELAKKLNSKIVENTFFILKIENKDIDLNLIGNYVVLVKYDFKANGRSIIKEVDFKITTLQAPKELKEIVKPKLLVNDTETFDGVDIQLILIATEERQRLN